MDQLKQVMAQLAKHQFWIISALAVILAIVGFFLTSSTLSKLYTDQASALDQRYNDINTVRSNLSTHPNDVTKEKMDAIIADVRDDVEAAWKLQYERQAKLLVWPVEALSGMKLIDKLKKYHPIETTLTYPEEPTNIFKTEREAYAIYFADQVPKIVSIIGTEWVGKASDNASMGGGMMGMGMGMEGGMGSGGEGYGDGAMGMGMGMSGSGMGNSMTLSKDLVIWPKASQDELINSIRLWRGNAPTVYEILYTQENMWILEGIMRIIAKTNEGAKANFQAPIKEIEFIRIGKAAVGRAGMIDSPMSTAGMGMGMGMGSMGMDGGMGEMGMGSMEMSMGDSGGSGSGGGGEPESSEGGTGMVMTIDPANGRYVDATYNPITGDDLRTKMQSSSPEDAYFAVAKRIPVRLRFKMDQRKLPQFLADCGNAALMLEIRQVRIGDTTPASASGSMGMGGMGMGGMGMSSMGMGGGRGMDMGMGMDGGMGMGSEGDGMGSMGMGMGMGSMGTVQTKPAWEMPVEVYGVIYLYNPVSIERLGLSKVTEDTEVSDTVDTPAVEEPAAPIEQPQSEGGEANGNNANGQPATNGDANAATGNGAANGSTPADGNVAPNSGNPADAGTTQPPANPQ